MRALQRERELASFREKSAAQNGDVVEESGLVTFPNNASLRPST